jgi:hypothetical protein
MPPLIDLTNQRFGKLKVVSLGFRKFHPSGQSSTQWNCHCDCGNDAVVNGQSLRNGTWQSCGNCVFESPKNPRGNRLPKGRGSTHPLYKVWSGMFERCSNKGHPSYHNYGGRGIYVCDRWLGPEGFLNFLDDMAPRPEGTYASGRATHSLDRTDNDGPYSPDNCEWKTQIEQCANQRPKICLQGALMGRIDDVRGNLSREAWIELQLEACLAKGVLHD